jgi:hypothetical protein
VNPDCVVGFLYIERAHAGVFMKIIAIGDIVRDPGKLRDGGVFFSGSELLVWQEMLLVDAGVYSTGY